MSFYFGSLFVSAMGTSEKPPVSNTKKRALEALERRFSVAKAEILQQQHKNNKPAHDKEEGTKKQSSSINFPAHELKASYPSTPTSSSKKGLPFPKSSCDLEIMCIS